MRLRNNPQAGAELALSPFVIDSPADWPEGFGTGRLLVEIGSGKGDFALAMAAADPSAALLCLERSPTVAAIFARKVARLAEPPRNLLIVVADAAEIKLWLGGRKVAGFFLNFSDPWPKKRHARRRLTHRSMLDLYSSVASADARLTLTTDNEQLYRFTLEEAAAAGCSVCAKTEDLRIPLVNGAFCEPVSEYHRRFLAAGKPIYRTVLSLNGFGKGGNIKER